MNRLRPATLRGRLAAGMTALSIAVLATAGVLIYGGVRRTLLASLDGALLSIARTEVASEFDEPGIGLHVHEEASASLVLPLDSRTEKLARITDATGRVLVASANLGSGAPLADDEELRRRALGGTATFADLRRGHVAYRAVYFPFAAPGDTTLVAMVALPKQPTTAALHAVLVHLALSLLVAAVAAGWGAARIARRLTAPLERIAETARAIRGGRIGARIPEVSTDAELRALTDILNEMLGSLEAALETERQTATAQRRFVADASHELRSPLANLRGTIEVALRRPRSNAEYEETLGAAVREIERLSRLANDLLTLSRIDAGNLDARPAPCDPVPIARDALAAFAARAAEKELRLRLEAPPSLAAVADADRLRQVLDNLLDNALRHAPPGSSVTVTAAARDDAVLVAVRDEGPGLTAEEQAHVFDRFYRTDLSRARTSGGLGLGLAIAKAIVEAHGGTLTVESEPGAGATFLARFPSGPRA